MNDISSIHTGVVQRSFILLREGMDVEEMNYEIDYSDGCNVRPSTE